MSSENLENLLKERDYPKLILEILRSLSMEEILKTEELIRTEFKLEDLDLSNMQSKNIESQEADSKVNLTLEDVGSLTNIKAIKILNKVMSLGVSDSRVILDNLPSLLFENISKEEAEAKVEEFNAVEKGLVFKISS